MTELLPCPFCGCTAIYVTHTHYYDDEDTVCMFCNGCKSIVILESNEAEGINDKTRAEAIEAWNTRVERTCHRDEYEAAPFSVCSECGAVLPDDCTVYYCWSCGAKVVGE